MIHHGDCLDVMAAMEPESVDAIVTDPPYDLLSASRNGSPRRNLGKPGNPFARHDRGGAAGGFMGKAWDGTGIAFRPETWAAAFRVAKPSAYLLAFGGTRTVHRMTCAIEDAGWIIRDMLVWAYASGFPKSKASLKPAWEPIVMARKPGPLRDLAIDACRIEASDEPVIVRRNLQGQEIGMLSQGPRPIGEIASASPLGRWPANVILTDPIFDGGIEGVVGGGDAGPAGVAVNRNRGGGSGGYGGWAAGRGEDVGFGDSGTYSRFFVIPKASRADREPALTPDWFEGSGRVSTHPTVKPVDLMRHLVRLVTPPGGIVLDPFLGSGTTGIACEMEGFPWIGIEREAEYVAIAEARLVGVQRGLGLETA
jgi:site-specific DNA-methyltransferase (adenine-specific)